MSVMAAPFPPLGSMDGWRTDGGGCFYTGVGFVLVGAVSLLLPGICTGCGYCCRRLGDVGGEEPVTVQINF